jgi:hypothetical protein
VDDLVILEKIMVYLKATIQNVIDWFILVEVRHPEGICRQQRPHKDSRKGKRPTSLGQILVTSKWEMPLADWITATGFGFAGQEMCDKEAERVEKMTGGEGSHFSENDV